MLVLGKSAAGKTTFIKSLYKKYLAEGVKAGYVMQNFDEQIVTDKVWHELCFALENLGTDRLTMQRRVAEVCSYFGISSWLKKDTALLSGGQKQLLNLASVMATTPDVLLLDEHGVNRTLPVILCGEENVSGTHGASAGRLHEDMLFYLSSRGLDRAAIERMMTGAQLSRALEALPAEAAGLWGAREETDGKIG